MTNPTNTIDNASVQSEKLHWWLYQKNISELDADFIEYWKSSLYIDDDDGSNHWANDHGCLHRTDGPAII
jgi:hypothetical protein